MLDCVTPGSPALPRPSSPLLATPPAPPSRRPAQLHPGLGGGLLLLHSAD